MAYSDKVLDHYENPRNVGSFAKNADDVGTGMVGAPACGDVMKLQIKVGKDGVIEDAKFKTYGCGSAIASSSLVTEWVKGKTLDEAAAIRNTQIAEELALPPVKIHCSILAEDAIKAAVADYKTKHGGAQGATAVEARRSRRRIERGAGDSRQRTADRPRGRIQDGHHIDRIGGEARREPSRQARQGRRAAPRRAHVRLLRPRVQDRVRRRRASGRPLVPVSRRHRLVDPKSLQFLDGTELDFAREGLNEGFKFNNPNVKDACGCGESFNV